MDLTPVIDMSFLLIVFFLCLPFKALDHKLAAFLPTDRGILGTPFRPPEEAVISVRIRRDSADPLRARYLCGETATGDIEEVARRIREGAAFLAREGIELVGEISAAPDVPLKHVVAVLNKFREAEVDPVRFEGCPPPPRGAGYPLPR